METAPHNLPRELGLFDLVSFNVIAVLGVQWIPASAHVGPVAIPLHLSAALLFFVPSALAVASLSRRFPGEGGFYAWTHHAFGDWHAFLCGWCWLVSVLLYLPGLLIAATGMAAEAVGSARLANDPVFLVGASLALLWTSVGANVVGFRIGKWVNNTGTALTIAGGATILIASLLVWSMRDPATRFDMLPQLDWDRVSLWAQIAFAYTGLELGSLLAAEVRDPARTIPKAVWISGLAVTSAYVLGSISLMLILPPDRIHPMTGLVAAADAAGKLLGAPWLATFAAALLFAGVLGKLTAWSAGSARLPFLAGVAGSLPAAFAQVHARWRTPHIALISQGAACTVFVVAAHAGESASAGWLTLIDMAILTGFLPFVYIFLAASRYGQRLSAACGLGVTLAAMMLSLVPPARAASVSLFYTKVLGGAVLLAGLGWLTFRINHARKPD